MSRIVIALGGNALGNTPYEQLELVTETAKPIVDLIEAGNEVIIAHGNGPQVGMINLAMSAAAEAGAVKSDMPFPECGAMSQGYIGYHLQNAIGNELVKRGINKPVATIVTQVLVDENDGAFQKPTKPIGAFYTKEQADEIAATKGFTMVEDAGPRGGRPGGRGCRRGGSFSPQALCRQRISGPCPGAGAAQQRLRPRAADRGKHHAGR